METSAKNKLLAWVVVLLIIANVAVLATVWTRHNKDEKKIKRESPGDFLIRELSFDKNQQEQFAVLRKNHQQQSFKIRGKIKDARNNFFKLLQQSNVSDSEKISASTEVAKHLQALDMLTFDHFKEVRNICNPSQQKKFDEVIEEVLKMMTNAPPQGQRLPANANGKRLPPPGEQGSPNDDLPPPPDR